MNEEEDEDKEDDEEYDGDDFARCSWMEKNQCFF